MILGPWECEKWILYKILHRLWYPKIFSEIFFSTKKIILKIEIFDFWKMKNFHKGEKKSLKNYFFRKFNFSMKIFFRLYEFFSFFKNRKFQFSKLFFSSKNFESEKKLDIKIDVKFYRESIFGIYFGIRALLRPPSEFLSFFSLTGIWSWESWSHLVKWPDVTMTL